MFTKYFKPILYLIIFSTSISHSQDFEVNDRSVTAIFKIKNSTKAQLFTEVNKWVATNYNSAKNVIDMKNKESGTIIVKGINDVNYTSKIDTKGVYKTIQKQILDVNQFYHFMELNVKDNKMRVIYKITEPSNVDIGWNDIVFNVIKLNGVDQISMANFKNKIDEILKKGFSGKKKREIFKKKLDPFIEQVNQDILENIKVRILSIYSSVKTGREKDDW